MRATTHNGRAGKDGAFSPLHNDRNFDLDKAEHINQDKTTGNWYWVCYKNMTFDAAEKKFYEQHFSAALQAKNERYTATGHKERCKTIEEYRSHKLYCPEEVILQVGKLGDTISPKTLLQACVDQANWELKKYPNVKILDMALHVDEQGAPHVHIRKVWVAHDKAGQEMVGQAAALREMGISAPHPEKPLGRHNNAKMTYTKECREHFIELCKEKNLEIEETPKDASKTGLSLIEYQRRQELEQLEAEKGQYADMILDKMGQIRQLMDEEKQLQQDLSELVDLKNQAIEMAQDGDIGKYTKLLAESKRLANINKALKAHPELEHELNTAIRQQAQQKVEQRYRGPSL